jgi:lipopolysaccharide/colanic/teichoic acid biosynthesis glycosyltransferase
MLYRNFFKNILDKILAILLLPFFLILIFILAIYILIIDGRPVFYLTERIGKDMKKFKMIKLRTMRKDADKILEEILKDENLKREYDLYKKLKPDPRLIKGGLFIRKHSLDELPQIFNILKGDMSFVGPRPYLVDTIVENYPKEIFSVKPGLTGLWQVSGRNELAFEERVKLDLEYVKNLNLFLDLKILLKTIKEIIFPHGAY